MPHTNNNNQLYSRHRVLYKRLKNAIRTKHVAVREMRVGKPVDLNITSECECAICLETLTKKNIAITPCGHKFCFTCLMENFKVSKACPLCRTTIGPELPKPRLTDHDIGELVYLNGANMMREVLEFGAWHDKQSDMDLLESDSESENEIMDVDPSELTNEYTGINELFQDVSNQMDESNDSGEGIGSDSESSSDDSDSENNDEYTLSSGSDDDSDNESETSLMMFEDLENELERRLGGGLSNREKGILTICLKHIGETCYDIRNWYDKDGKI